MGDFTEIADKIYESYKAFRVAGFSEEQAFELAKAILIEQMWISQ